MGDGKGYRVSWKGSQASNPITLLKYYYFVNLTNLFWVLDDNNTNSLNPIDPRHEFKKRGFGRMDIKLEGGSKYLHHFN